MLLCVVLLCDIVHKHTHTHTNKHIHTHTRTCIQQTEERQLEEKSKEPVDVGDFVFLLQDKDDMNEIFSQVIAITIYTTP